MYHLGTLAKQRNYSEYLIIEIMLSFHYRTGEISAFERTADGGNKKQNEWRTLTD